MGEGGRVETALLSYTMIHQKFNERGGGGGRESYKMPLRAHIRSYSPSSWSIDVK